MKEGTIGEAGGAARGVDPPRADRRRVLFFMRPGNVDSGLDGLVGALLERDHEVIVALDGNRALSRAQGRALADLAARHPQLEQLRIPPRGDLWHIPAGAIRRGLDFLDCLDAQPPVPDKRRSRARDRAPRLLRALLVMPPFRWAFGRQMLRWLLRRLEAGLPIRRETRAMIQERSPDAVIVSRGAELGSPDAELVRSAQATRTPSMLVVNGTDAVDPARLRDMPTLAVIADHEQANELVREHGLSRDRIQAVGGEDIDGVRLPSRSAAVDAIDEASEAQDVSGPPGRFLRPVLWLLTPLLALALPLLRPRATIRAIRKRRRTARKRAAAARKTQARDQAVSQKARGKATKQEKRARTEEAKQQKQEKHARTEEAKQRKLARAQEKQRKRERGESAE